VRENNFKPGDLVRLIDVSPAGMLEGILRPGDVGIILEEGMPGGGIFYVRFVEPAPHRRGGQWYLRGSQMELVE
jgi:hypothetical protein